MSPNEPSRQNRPTPPGATRTRGARGRRPARDDLEECPFGVALPMPTQERFPTLTRRFAAFGLDLLIGTPMVVLALAIGYAISSATLARYDALARCLVTTLIVYALYFTYWESSHTRATPGKILLDLRVATVSGKPLSATEAMLRFLLRIASLVTLNAGFWHAWRDPRGQALHDRICRTVVIAPHVTHGQLRRAVRAPRRDDRAAAFLASVVAGAFVFMLSPAVLRDAALADRIETAVGELAPAFVSGQLTMADGRWSQRLRTANDEVAAVGFTLEVDAADEAVVLRASPVLAGDEAGTGLEGPPSIRLTRTSAAEWNPAWSCRNLPLLSYAVLPRCHRTPAVTHPIPWLAEADAVAQWQ